MTILEIIGLSYIVGGAVTSPFIWRMARREFEASVQSGKVPPGTEMFGLLISQVVSVAVWPLTVLLWAVGLATQLLKQRKS